MKTLKCPNCGASIKEGDIKCEYCGATFELSANVSNENTSSDATKKVTLPTLSDSQLVANIKNYLHPTNGSASSKYAIIPLIFFMVLWTSVCIFLISTSLSHFPGMAFVPFLMMVTGISTMIGGIASSLNLGNKKLFTALDENNFDEALSIAKSKSYKSQKMLAVAIMIEHYHSKDYTHVKNAITYLKPITISSSTQYTLALKNVCDYFNYPPESTSAFSSISFFK